MTITTTQAAAGLAVLGAVGAGAFGYLSPREAACEVERARLEERVKTLEEVKVACKEALTACANSTGASP